MTLSSAEKNSTVCPWRFPVPSGEDFIQLQSAAKCRCSLADAITERAHTDLDFIDGKQGEVSDMGNVTASTKTQSSTGCNPLLNPEKKLLKQQNELNSRQKTYEAPSKYINGTSEKSKQKSSPTEEEVVSASQLKLTESDTERRSTSPLPNGTQHIQLTKDVNNSRSTTPILSRKLALGPHRDPTSHSSTSTTDQHRSNSSGSLKDSQAKDIMISYSHLDKEIMLKLKDVLEAHNISVWVDVVGLNAGVNFLNKIGQAIIDSKMFITLLTERTVASKFCQDELALAYISNKPIFPVSVQPQDEIFPKIPTGMKLQLARFEWTQISMEHFDTDVKVLLTKLKACLAEDEDDGAKEEVRDEVAPLSPSQQSDKPLTRKPVLKKRSTRIKIYNKTNRSLSRTNSIIEQTEEIDSSAEFWDRNFGEAKTVRWESFESAFMKDYEKQLNMTYAHSDKDWFIDILKRELEVEEMLIHKDKYKEFISEECDGKIKEQPILKCVNDLAVENYTMKEVFNMDSSVRIDAINNLSKFGSVAVVEALLDLLDDQEHDVRASACISLAKSKAGDLSMKIDRLMRCLRDTDRFVRESACIALGYLKAETAVPALLQIWRNDYISSVRDAAELALQQIGGEEVNRAMQMTKVLTAEIEELINVLTGKRTSPKNGTHKKWGPMKPFNTLPPTFSAHHNPNLSALTLAPVPHKNTL